MKVISRKGLASVTLAVLAMVGLWLVADQHETASAAPMPPVETGCAIFGVPADECPNGALVIQDACGIPEIPLTSPSSSLSSYASHLDIDAILDYIGPRPAGFEPELDEDGNIVFDPLDPDGNGRFDLFSGYQATG